LRECCKRSLAAKRFWCIVALKLSSSPLAYWSVFRSVVANIICPSDVCGDKNNGVAPTGFWLWGDCPYRAHGVGAHELDYRPAMFVRLCRLKPRSQHINSSQCEQSQWSKRVKNYATIVAYVQWCRDQPGTCTSPVSNGTRANLQSPPPAAWQQNSTHKNPIT